MSMVEKLFVEIFERKKRIIEQVKHRTDLFDQYLASKCLLEGIHPPPWLLSSSFPSFSSDPNELKKDELISGLLLLRPQSAQPYSNTCYSLYQRPIVDGKSEGLPNGSYREVDALNKGIDAGDRLSALPQFRAEESQCTLNSVTSPEDFRDARISNNCLDHDQSLVRIQRSKSRQRALELRGSARAGTIPSHENNDAATFSNQIIGSGIASLQYDHADKSELAKALDVNNEGFVEEYAKIGECEGKVICSDVRLGRSTRSRSPGQENGSAHEPDNLHNASYIFKGDVHAQSVNGLIKQPNHVNESELVNLSPAIANASCASEEISTGNCRGKQLGSNIHHGTTTRSRSSSAQFSSEKEPLDKGQSSCVDEEECELRNFTDRSAQQPKYVDNSSELVTPPSVISNEIYEAMAAEKEDKQSKEMGSDINVWRIIGSRNSSLQPNCVKESLKLGCSCGSGKEDGCGRLKQQPVQVCDVREIVLPFVVTENCEAESRVWDCQSNEKRDDCCGITRSITLKLDHFCGKGTEDGVTKSKQDPDHVDEEGNDTYCSIITRTRSFSQQFDTADRFTKICSFPDIANDGVGTLVRSFDKLSKLPQQLSLAGGGVDLQDVSGIQNNVLLCSDCSDIIDLERCNTVVPETCIDSYRLDEACSVVSGSNSAGSSKEMEVLVSKPPTEWAVLVKPKQHDFDDVEVCITNETSDLSVENKLRKSSERQPSTLLRSKYVSDNVASHDYQEILNSSIEMPLREELEESSCEEDKVLKVSPEGHGKGCVVFADETTISSRQQKISLNNSQNQNADSHFFGSWPRHKRIKMGVQLTSSVSAFPSLMTKSFQLSYKDHIGDSVQLNDAKSQTEDMQQNVEHHLAEASEFSSPNLHGEEVEPNLEGRGRNANLMSQEQRAASLSSLTKMSCGNFQGRLLEKPEVEDPTSTMFDVREQRTAEKNQVSLHTEDGFEMKSTEILNCTAKIMPENIFHPEGDGDMPYLSVTSPHRHSMEWNGCNQNLPEFEGFVIDTDDAKPCFSGLEVNFDKLDLPNTALERASVLEHLCRSASLQTQLSHFSTTFQTHRTVNLHSPTQNGLLEGMELRATLNLNGDAENELEASYCLNGEVNSEFLGRSFDSPPFYNAQCAWDIKKPYGSPIEKHWEGITSKSGSSKTRTSSIPELPCINEENENTDEVIDTRQKGIGSEPLPGSAKKEPLLDITNNANPLTSFCETEIPGDRCSVASVNMDFSFNGACNEVKQKLRNQNSNKRRNTAKGKENESVRSRANKSKVSGKSSLREGVPCFSEACKGKNIVSNITSFVPLVRQKQAAAVITEKRDVKVKALEAAKRLAEKKENERKSRKEALRLERAKIQEKILRQLELEKEKREEQRKKELSVAVRKRQREEVERKEKERKRKRVEEARKQQQEHGGRLGIEKEQKEMKSCAADARDYQKMECKDKPGKYEKMGKVKGDNNPSKIPETEPTNTRVLEDCQAFSDCRDNSKELGSSGKTTESHNLCLETIREQSYEISPYKGSEDEGEDDDEIPNTKFIPAWASKSQLALAVSFQQRIDPESIFFPESFCDIAEGDVATAFKLYKAMKQRGFYPNTATFCALINTNSINEIVFQREKCIERLTVERSEIWELEVKHSSEIDICCGTVEVLE